MKTVKTRSSAVRAKTRRDFLLAAGLGSAGVAATLATVRKAGSATPAAPAEKPVSGYRVSEHILKYYKTTEV